MKTQKILQIVFLTAFLTALLTFGQVKIYAQSREKEWISIHEQTPDGSARYTIKLKFEHSDSTFFYGSSRSNIESESIGEHEIHGFKNKLDFGKQIDGFQYLVLINAAPELQLLNRDGRYICKVLILRSMNDEDPQIFKEGYFLLSNNIEFSSEISGEHLNLDIEGPLSCTFSVNIYGNNPYSYRGSLSPRIKGKLAGSIFTSSTNLEVSITYRDSLETKDAQVKLALKPFDKELPYDSASGSITDILRLHSTKLVVEKIAADGSEIVLAAIHGDLDQSREDLSNLSINKPIPAFSRVELIGRQLLTSEELCKKAGRKGHVVIIFGDLKRQPTDYYRPDQEIRRLTLDETMILDILQGDSENKTVVVFVCREILFSDLYEKWLNEDPGFYVISDYSNPMDMQLWLPSHGPSRRHRPDSTKETLRERLSLPADMVSILLIDDQGNLTYIDIDAGRQLEESLTRIKKMIMDNKPAKKAGLF